MADQKQALGGTAIKPEGWDRSGFEAMRYFLYDPKRGTIMGRTPMSWAKITGFYIVYYSFLAAFWLFCMQMFMLTVPLDRPKWMLSGSLIGNNPGVGRRPSNPDIEIDSSIIMLEAKDTNTRPTNDEGEGTLNADWAMRMKHFMEKYDNKTGLYDCNENKHDHGRCIFNLEDLGECATYPYGYFLTPEDKENGLEYVQPCILLKLNRIYGWAPNPIDPANLDDAQYDRMSDKLKEIIRNAENKDQVWLDCQGRYPADNEALAVEFFPKSQGIPIINYPYRGGNYHSPVVAVKLRTDQLMLQQVGQLIHVECRVWFDGVIHDTKEMAGLVRFELMLKNNRR